MKDLCNAMHASLNCKSWDFLVIRVTVYTLGGVPGLEAFIDTPLKHYSSGMTARLGFSVAAFLDADILLFGEVLAVGDKDFVQKCNEKIDAFQRQGKTMVLVNHSRDAIRRALHARLFVPQGTVGDARRHRSGVGALCAFRLTLARVGICKRHPERSQKSQRS